MFDHSLDDSMRDSGGGYTSEPIPIDDFFDVDDISHLQAYKHLQATGMWPENFIPERVKLTGAWSTRLEAKMAERWIDHSLRTRVPYAREVHWISSTGVGGIEVGASKNGVHISTDNQFKPVLEPGEVVQVAQLLLDRAALAASLGAKW